MRIRDDMTELREFYRARGLQVHRTASQGDCGIDAILCCEGRARNALTWQETRTRLMTLMWEAAEEPEWHDVWAICAENDPPVPGGLGPGADATNEEEQDDADDADHGLPPIDVNNEFLEEFALEWGPVKPAMALELVARLCPERLAAFKVDLTLARQQARLAHCSYMLMFAHWPSNNEKIVLTCCYVLLVVHSCS